MTTSEVAATATARSTSILDLRFIVLSGKGGVGKTTVAAALARAAWASGKRVLVAQTDAAERLGHLLGHDGPIGPTVRTVLPGLDAVNMTARESLHQYGLLVLRYEAVYRALFDNRAVRGFLSAVPGLDAYAMLGKAWWHTTETVASPATATATTTTTTAGGPARPPELRPKYDLVILDGPASGHAIAMLKIPGAILSTMPAGPLAKDARALMALLSDPERAAICIVTRPEDLPARETVELARATRALPGLTLGPLIVNAVPREVAVDPSVFRIVDRLASPTGDDILDDTVRRVSSARARKRAAEHVLDELRQNPGLPMLRLPELPGGAPLGIDEVGALSRFFLPPDAELAAP